MSRFSNETSVGRHFGNFMNSSQYICQFNIREPFLRSRAESPRWSRRRSSGHCTARSCSHISVNSISVLAWVCFSCKSISVIESDNQIRSHENERQQVPPARHTSLDCTKIFLHVFYINNVPESMPNVCQGESEWHKLHFGSWLAQKKRR